MQKVIKCFYLQSWIFYRRSLLWTHLLVYGLCVSCVSLNFNLPQDQKAKGVVFQAPPPPYQKILKKGMDSAYENSQSKSIIAFFSNCSAVTRWTSLKDFQKDLLDNLKSFKLQTQTKTTHQDQKALNLFLQGATFEVSPPSRKNMRLFLFKKDKCFYALSFVGDSVRDSLEFRNFIKEFKAP